MSILKSFGHTNNTYTSRFFAKEFEEGKMVLTEENRGSVFKTSTVTFG